MPATSNIERRTLNGGVLDSAHECEEPIRIFNASIQTAERNKLNRRRQSGRL